MMHKATLKKSGRKILFHVTCGAKLYHFNMVPQSLGSGLAKAILKVV